MIVEKYPDQWVALDDVDYYKGDLTNVVGGRVVCGMSDYDYPNVRLRHKGNGKRYVYMRTSDPCLNNIGVWD